MNPAQFRKLVCSRFIDLRTLDENDEEVFNTVYYKEIPVVTGSMDETIIVTDSLKYKAYQRKISARQIERAQKIIVSTDRKRKGKIRMIPCVSSKRYLSLLKARLPKSIYNLDMEQIREKMYDGFYAVITDLEGDVSEILKINRRR